MNTYENRDRCCPIMFKKIKAVSDSHGWHMGSNRRASPCIASKLTSQVKLDVQRNNLGQMGSNYKNPC